MIRALIREHLLYQWRTFRLQGLLLAFTVTGLLSPAAAYFTPRVLAALPPEELEGIQILMTRSPAADDAFAQYTGNFSLVSLLVVLVVSGALAGEFSRGTASTLFSRPVRRSTVYLARLSAVAAPVLGGLVLAGVLCSAYTWALFGPLDLATVAWLHGLLALRLLLDVSLAMSMSALTSSTLMAGGTSLGGALLLNVIGALPVLGARTPGALTGHATRLAHGQAVDGLLPAALGAALLALVLTCVGLWRLRDRPA
ncbi:MAG: ABC transporter permease subunit [Pseudomonadota bacterium]